MTRPVLPLALLVLAAACGGSPDGMATRQTGDHPPGGDGGVTEPDADPDDDRDAAAGDAIITPPDAAEEDAGAADGGETCDPCAAEPVSWSLDGQLVAYETESHLTDCTRYRHVRRPAEGGEPSAECEQAIDRCTRGDRLGSDTVALALTQPGVQDALAAAPITYGRDLRPVDGAVLVLEIGSRQIIVGSECDSAPDCVAPPADVRALANVLQTLDQQQHARGPCSTAL